MKTAIIVSLLLLSGFAHSAVWCESYSDPTDQRWFPCCDCPAGYFFVGYNS